MGFFRLVRNFFVVMGIAATIAMGAGVRLYFTDRPRAQPLIDALSAVRNSVPPGSVTLPEVTPDTITQLGPTLEQMLQNVGIDIASMPAASLPDLVACLNQNVGTDRVNEIRAGVLPSAVDFLNARACLP